MSRKNTPEYLKALHTIMRGAGPKVSNKEIVEAMLEEGLAKPHGSELCQARVAVFGKRAKAPKGSRIKTTGAGKPGVGERLREIITQLGPAGTSAEVRRQLTKEGYKEPSGTRIKKIFSEVHGAVLVTRSAKPPKRTTLSKAVTADTGSGVATISDKMKYDLIQAKETAQLVGGLDRLIELATWLKNWQL